MRRFSLYEPVEFINTFLKDKLEWDQVSLPSAYCLVFSLVWTIIWNVTDAMADCYTQSMKLQ